MKIIAYQTHNNRVSLMVPSLKWAKSLEELAEKDVPANSKWVVIDTDKTKLPDDVFFHATEWDDVTGIKLNILKAKEIWLDHYRKARNPLLAALDVDFMRAVESSNTDLQTEIAQKKQALRDVTKTKLPETLEGIKNTWPEILGEKPF
jgi:hypothetical protein